MVSTGRGAATESASALTDGAEGSVDRGAICAVAAGEIPIGSENSVEGCAAEERSADFEADEETCAAGCISGDFDAGAVDRAAAGLGFDGIDVGLALITSASRTVSRPAATEAAACRGSL